MKIHYTIKSYLEETNQSYLVGISSRDNFENNGYLVTFSPGSPWCSCNEEESLRNYKLSINHDPRINYDPWESCKKCVEKRGLIRRLKLKRILENE